MLCPLTDNLTSYWGMAITWVIIISIRHLNPKRDSGIVQLQCIRYYIIINPIKTLRSIRIAKTICRQRCTIYCPIIPIPTGVIGVAIERVISHQALL